MSDPRSDFSAPVVEPPRAVRVLVAEDDASSRRLLALALEGAGYIVETAGDGHEAVERVVADPPEVVLLDFEMPVMDGVEVCAALRQHEHPEVSELPIIMLTAHDDDAAEVACLDAGANDYVTKPVARSSLIARIETQRRLRALNTALRTQNEELARWREAQMADLEAAQRVQRAILPATKMLPGWRLATHFAPLIQVGGDIYGVEARTGARVVWLADATGHGVAAALCTTLVAILFQRACRASGDPQEILSRVNAGLFAIFRGSAMMSGACAVISGGEMHFTGAGHPPLLIRRQSGEVESLASRSRLLGLTEAFPGEVQTVRLAAGDRVLLFTDGIYSARTAEGERREPASVAEAFRTHRSLPALIDSLRGEGVFDDDATALLLQRTEDGSPSRE